MQELLFKEPENIIYSDAGYWWKQEKKTGIVAYKINQQDVKMFNWSCQKISGLKQYTNLFELTAATFALFEAYRQKLDDILLITDSKVCYWWLVKKRNKLRKFSEQHFKVKELADILKKKFRNLEIMWRPREENQAGWAIEDKYGL